MEKEKIKQIYQKFDIIVDDQTIENILQDKQKVQGLMRIYKDEEIDSMNYIFNKPHDNKYFTKIELMIASKVNLFDREVLRKYKEVVV